MSEPIEINLPPYEGEPPLYNPGMIPELHYYNRDEPVSTNYLHIELSKDLNAEALADEIRKAMDRASQQIRIQRPEAQLLFPEQSDLDESESGHICSDGCYVPSKAEIRAFIREEVHRTIYPSAELANPHEHMRVEMTTEQGKKWRGVLYGVEGEQ